MLDPREGVSETSNLGDDQGWIRVRGQVPRSPLLQRLDRYFSAGVRFDPAVQLTLQPIWKLLDGEELTDTWRARPLCLYCGLPGEMKFTFGGERGVLCLLDARHFFPHRQLPNPRLIEWLVADVFPRMRAKRGRPNGSSDLPIDDLEQRVADAVKRYGRRATLTRVALDINVASRTIQRRLKNERATTFRDFRARQLRLRANPGQS